jgi:hypothetical protein
MLVGNDASFVSDVVKYVLQMHGELVRLVQASNRSYLKATLP